MVNNRFNAFIMPEAEAAGYSDPSLMPVVRPTRYWQKRLDMVPVECVVRKTTPPVSLVKPWVIEEGTATGAADLRTRPKDDAQGDPHQWPRTRSPSLGDCPHSWTRMQELTF